jgi:hypothetical protein
MKGPLSISLRQTSHFLASLCISVWVATSAYAADATPSQSTPPAPAQDTKNKDGSERNFYEVLNDVLGDFEYDLKNGNVIGLKSLAIRNIAMSENIPPSFKNHLELLITEKVLKNTKSRMIQCLPCKSKQTSLNGNQIVITSPDSNPSELSRIAKLSGIENYMDVAFSYQPSGIVLSMYIMDPESGSILWSRGYNSETSKAAAFRRGVDYNQIDDARRETEYAPTIQHRLGLMYLFTPNLPSTSGNLALAFRMAERYDNRKKEVGFELNYMTDASTIINKTGAAEENIYKGYGLNMTLLFIHAWNFIGEEENYNQMRGGTFIGLGGTYASGYLGALIRSGYEWRLGKHFGVSLNLGYRPTSTAFLNSTASGKIGGLEYGLGVNLLF